MNEKPAITFPNYMRFSENKLRSVLRKDEIPQEIIERIVRVVLDEKEQLRKARIKTTVHKKLWNELLKPLRQELKLIRASLLYEADQDQERNAARSEAYASYEKILVKLRDILNQYAELNPPMTPHQVAIEKSKPNNGEHWTDWIPDTQKARIFTLFDAIPYKPRAKRKVPFVRSAVIPAQLRRLLKQRGMIEYRHALLVRKGVIDPILGNDANTQRELAQLASDLSRLNKQIKEYDDACRSEK